MSKHLERDLELLEAEILAMSAIVEEMIDKASRALRELRSDLAEAVFEHEREIDDREVQIEEHCLKILALHQPVAIDLRRAATVLKINNDLERIADLAVNVAERSQSLAAYPHFPAPAHLEEMARLATEMVHDALDAFVHFDADSARRICWRDDEVDSLNREVIDELQNVMREHSELVEPALYFFSASRHLERMADHATNIAEDVQYLVDGEIARHKHGETPLAE